MTANHPYPNHVQSSVAQALSEFEGNPRGYDDAQEFYNDMTDAVLQALWDASRVEHLSEVERLPNKAMLRTRLGEFTFAGTMKQMTTSGDYPAHIVHWGNHDR